MLPISTKELHRFTPKSCEGMDRPPVYLLAVPTLAGRGEYRRQMALAGAANPPQEVLLRHLADAVRGVVAEDQRADLLALIARAQAAEELDPDDAQRLTDLERQLLPFHPPLAAAVADRLYHNELLPLVACKCFLRGVENVPVPFETAGGRVTDDTLAALDQNHLHEAGWAAFALMFVPRGQEKNSERPSPSPSAPATSAAADCPPTPPSSGGCSGKSTKKTPASA